MTTISSNVTADVLSSNGMSVSSNPNTQINNPELVELTEAIDLAKVRKLTNELTTLFADKELAYSVCGGNAGAPNSKVNRAYKQWVASSNKMKVVLSELVESGYDAKFIFTDAKGKKVSEKSMIPYVTSGQTKYLAVTTTAKSLDKGYRIVVTVQGFRKGTPYMRVKEISIELLWLKYGGSIDSAIQDITGTTHAIVHDSTLIKKYHSETVTAYETAIAADAVSLIKRTAALSGKQAAINAANGIQTHNRIVAKVAGQVRKEVRTMPVKPVKKD